MEKKPHKKEDLMLANNVLKLASKLLKVNQTNTQTVPPTIVLDTVKPCTLAC